jgi:hypothetical protein
LNCSIGVASPSAWFEIELNDEAASLPHPADARQVFRASRPVYNAGMTIEQFEASLSAAAPPAELPPLLAALWREGRGDWTGAHEIVQDLDTPAAAWIHAYLHRKEGDESNARYWYRMAGKPFPGAQSFEEEWRSLAVAMLC